MHAHTFAAMNAAGLSPKYGMDGDAASIHTVQIVLTGDPTAASYRVLGTAKTPNRETEDGDFEDISGTIDGVAEPMIHIVNKLIRQVRIEVISFTGGTDPTAGFVYIGE